jgi:hypothetical protein
MRKVRLEESVKSEGEGEGEGKPKDEGVGKGKPKSEGEGKGEAGIAVLQHGNFLTRAARYRLDRRAPVRQFPPIISAIARDSLAHSP